jgi:transporter family-2 protein
MIKEYPMIGIFIALISGALMSIQGVFNTGVTKSSSVWTASIIVQFTALCVCLGAWFITDRSSLMAPFKVEPKYMLLGGVIGALITYTVIKSIGALGPGQGILIIVTSQLLVAYLIELFGIFGVDKVGFQWQKLVGIIISIGGIILFKWNK